MATSKPARIVTFYSYKGGTGRSMALANIAWILASNSKRVLVVDWDLEAPGLQRYFRPFLVDRELVSSPGIVDLITAFILEAITPLEADQKLPPDWFLPLTDIDPYVISLDWKFPKGGLIDFIPAGRQGPDYAMRFAAINWQKFYDVLGGGAFIEELKLKMRDGYDYVLVDSRTGVSDTSGICTIQMPDSLVVCFTFNNQSIDGAASIAQGVFEQRLTQNSKPISTTSADKSSSNGSARRKYKHPYRFRVFPVPMRVDQAEKDKLELRQFYARWKFDPFIERIPAAARRSYWGSVEVPYVPFFAYEEILSPFKEDPSDPKSCLAAFTRIAMEITQQEVQGFTSLMSPEQNYAVLQEFASLPSALTSGLVGNNSAQAGTLKDDRSRSADGKTLTLTQTETELEKSIRLAETTLQNLDAEERDVARLLWMRLIRVPGPGEAVAISKVRAQVSELPRNVGPIINAFAAAGVLTITNDVELGETTVEVTNEDLLRSWPRLNTWIKADRDLMVWRQDLQISRARWQERGRLPAYLLVGRSLAEAKEWHQTHRKYLSDSEAEYIEASILEDNNRQKRERRNQYLRVAAAIAIVLAFVIAIFYFNKATNRIDRASEIAAIAQQKIDAATSGYFKDADQLQLGILLAVEAQRIAHTSQAEKILQTYLPLLPKKVTRISAGRPVLALAINPNGNRLLSVTGKAAINSNLPEDRTAQLYDLASGNTQGFLSFKPGSRTFRLSPDARYIAIAAAENGAYSVTVTELSITKVIATIQHRGPVYDMAFSNDGLYFATASEDRTAVVLDLSVTAQGRSPIVLAYPGAANAVAFSGDSRYLAVAGENFQVKIWQITPGRSSWPAPQTIQMESSAFIIDLSQTGQYLATRRPFANSMIDVWDVKNGKKIATLDNRPFEISFLSFTSDDRYIVVAGMANSGPTLRIWNVDGSKYDDALRVRGDLTLVSFSSDGKHLMAATGNSAAQLWRYDGSFKDAGLLIPQLNLTAIAFGASNLAVTAEADNIIRVWSLEAPVGSDLSSEACTRLTRDLKLEEWNAYLAKYLGGYRRTCAELP